ncbi:MAG: hypothetical protein NZ556_08950 [Fimbriimonadales bacterium]|nr:hypothetical protein [Fimbriimonadales bacterium]
MSSRWKRVSCGIPALLTLGLLSVGVWLWRHPVVGATMREQWRLLTERDTLTPWTLARASGVPEPLLSELHAYAQQRPQDWQIALAVSAEALIPTPPADRAVFVQQPPLDVARLQRFESLMARYPDRPEVAAAALRLSCQRRQNPLRPEAWAKIAAHGRTVDPENAFFDQMYAWYLYNQGREAQAWQVLMEGARKPRWDDYATAEVQALNALQELLGEPKALATALHETAVLYPHFAVLRQQARDTVAYAQKLRAAGRHAEANRLLRAQARLGAVMAVDANNIIAVMVGDVIIRLTAQGASDPATRAWMAARSAEVQRAITALRSARVEKQVVQLYRRANATLPLYRNALFWLGFSVLALASALILLLGARSRSSAVFAVLAIAALLVSLLLFGSMRTSALGTVLEGVEPIPSDIYESLSAQHGLPVQQWTSRLFELIGLGDRPRSPFAPLLAAWSLALCAACAYGVWRAVRRGVSPVAETRQALLWLFCIACAAYYINLWNYAHANRAVYQEFRELVDNQSGYYWRRAGVQPPPTPPLP